MYKKKPTLAKCKVQANQKLIQKVVNDISKDFIEKRK